MLKLYWMEKFRELLKNNPRTAICEFIEWGEEEERKLTERWENQN